VKLHGSVRAHVMDAAGLPSSEFPEAIVSWTIALHHFDECIERHRVRRVAADIAMMRPVMMQALSMETKSTPARAAWIASRWVAGFTWRPCAGLLIQSLMRSCLEIASSLRCSR
jgi:hypothetical protein